MIDCATYKNPLFVFIKWTNIDANLMGTSCNNYDKDGLIEIGKIFSF